ncbi:hypothetical protein DdX_15696 [Ditylenchus destructor]|uniref:Uncharacterized protein n=1 Tax=Ditylenchus destructor TaxID=166010 RepID=A0AAD4MRS2_9BILA|nr:hypothetical protein DdX_15696 [Ditylenchus destructor]
MASKTATNQSKRLNSTLKRPIFKSAQERYNQIAVPLERIQHRLCYECGEVVSAAAYDYHQMQHESVYLAYQLYYAEAQLPSSSRDDSFESTQTCASPGSLLDTPVEPNSASPPEVFIDVTSLDDEEVSPEDNQNSSSHSSSTLSIGNNFDLPGLSDENGKDLTQTEFDSRSTSGEGFEKPRPKTDLRQNQVMSMSQESLEELDRSRRSSPANRSYAKAPSSYKSPQCLRKDLWHPHGNNFSSCTKPKNVLDSQQQMTAFWRNSLSTSMRKRTVPQATKKTDSRCNSSEERQIFCTNITQTRKDLNHHPSLSDYLAALLNDVDKQVDTARAVRIQHSRGRLKLDVIKEQQVINVLNAANFDTDEGLIDAVNLLGLVMQGFVDGLRVPEENVDENETSDEEF